MGTVIKFGGRAKVSRLCGERIGTRFGRLEFLGQAGVDGRGVRLWRTRCDCGNERICLGTLLTSGRVEECEPCFDMKRPYHLRATDKHVSRLAQTLGEARWPLTRRQLKERVKLSDDCLYDSVAVLLDQRRLKVGYDGEERTYALAA